MGAAKSVEGAGDPRSRCCLHATRHALEGSLLAEVGIGSVGDAKEPMRGVVGVEVVMSGFTHSSGRFHFIRDDILRGGEVDELGFG